MERLTLVRPAAIAPPTAPHYLPQAPALLCIVLCLTHYVHRLEYAISPDGRLRLCLKTFAYLCSVGSVAVLLATGALYAALFLAGIVLAIAGVILAIAETLLGAALCLLGAWVVLQVISAMMQEQHKRRRRR